MDVAPTAAHPLISRVEAVRGLVISSAAALAAVGALLLIRRAAGAFSADLTALPLLATLILAAAIVFGGRLAWRGVGETRHNALLGWGGSLAILLVCLGCAWPNTQSLAWLLWLPLIGLDHWSRGMFLRHDLGSITARLDAAGIPPRTPPFQGGEVLLQQLERVRGEDGVESIRGTLRAEFVAGQRHATLYVGFCPPLERLPEIKVELVDGFDATVKIVQAFAHGARLEVRLSEPAEEACCVAVEFIAAPSAPLP